MISGRDLQENNLVLKNVTKRFGSFKAVDDFNLTVKKGEYCGFLGPSGCGKTTTLRMIAGHEIPTSGQIYINAKEVQDVQPRDRGTSLVFQNFALFPHLSVFENVGFALNLKGLSKEEIKNDVMEHLEIVGLQMLHDRKPKDLSGGEKQRVALARGLITKPEILLLDEPLGSLDEMLRIKMRGELKSLQRKLGITFVHVTHNQEEILSLGDKVVIMNNGLIEQVGSPFEIYTIPKTRFIASFVGDNNIFDGEVVSVNERILDVRTEEGVFAVDRGDRHFENGQKVSFSVRADLATTVFDGDAPRNTVKGVVKFVEYIGYLVKLYVELDNKKKKDFLVKEPQQVYFRKPYKEGDTVTAGCGSSDSVILTG